MSSCFDFIDYFLAIKDASNGTDDGTTFNENTTFPVNIDTSFSVFNQSIPCTDGDDTINVNFEAKADAQIMIGFVIAGTLTPPNITEASFFASTSLQQGVSGGPLMPVPDMTADLNGSLALDAGIVVSPIDTFCSSKV